MKDTKNYFFRDEGPIIRNPEAKVHINYAIGSFATALLVVPSNTGSTSLFNYSSNKDITSVIFDIEDDLYSRLGTSNLGNTFYTVLSGSSDHQYFSCVVNLAQLPPESNYLTISPISIIVSRLSILLANAEQFRSPSPIVNRFKNDLYSTKMIEQLSLNHLN